MTKVKEMFLAPEKYQYFQADVIKYITQALEYYLYSFLVLFKYYMLDTQFIFPKETAYILVRCRQSLASFWQIVLENNINWGSGKSYLS